MLDGKNGIIIPLYIYPEPSLKADRREMAANGDTEQYGAFYWQDLLALKKKYPKVPVIALVNPHNGPGESADPLLAESFQTLKDAGILCAGYISTKYAGMVSTIGLPQYPKVNIENDINSWYSFYPMIDGIFFDEMARGFDTSIHEYYKSIADFARRRGAQYIIMNPGLSINHRWYANQTADIFITWEKEFYPSITEAVADSDYAQQIESYGVERGCLVMGQKFKKHDVKWIMKPYYDWIYVTPSPLEPNPWDSIDFQTLKKLFTLVKK